MQLVARIKTLIRGIFRASRCTLQYEIPLFDGARFLTRAFYINWLSAHAVKRAPSKALNNVLRVVRSCIKMHATDEIMNTRKRLNNVLCVVRSCNKMHATWNYARDVSVVQQNARANRGKTRRCANVKQCKLKAWGVAVVDLWLFFEYHAEVKV